MNPTKIQSLWGLIFNFGLYHCRRLVADKASIENDETGFEHGDVVEEIVADALLDGS